MSKHVGRFNHLRDFLHAWFHQYFDLDGSVEEITEKFAMASSSADIDAVRRDIQAFLADPAAPDFYIVFAPDIEPAGWNMSPEEWLRWIDRLLSTAHL